jgi:hypothetical protein
MRLSPRDIIYFQAGMKKERLTMSTKLYGKYQGAIETTPFDGQYMDYGWNELPKTVDITCMPYCMMFDEFSRELANSLNQLTNYAHSLKAWNVVISSLEDQEKLDARVKFIDPIATIGLNLPYVIRSRFIFAVAHLCHQANRSRNGKSWQDDLPLDREIYFCVADKYGDGWRCYNKFKRGIERIGAKAYQKATHDFRDAYNHRFSPQLVIGDMQLVTRQIDTRTGQVSYNFRIIPALTLDVVVTLLREQCNYGYAAFEAFRNLVREHAATISSSSTASVGTYTRENQS